MAKNPSTRWFWNDWRLDRGVRACSIAARGVWIDLLAICAENAGYLLIDGRTPSISALAREISVERRQLSRLLVELEGNGVFSRTTEGVIFSRRMVRENGKKCAHHKAQKNATGTNFKHLDSFDNSEKTRTRARVPQTPRLKEDIYIHVREDGARAHTGGDDEPTGERLSRYDLLVAITRDAALKCERERLRREAEAIGRENRCGGTDPLGEQLWRRSATVEPQRAGMDRGGQTPPARPAQRRDQSAHPPGQDRRLLPAAG